MLYQRAPKDQEFCQKIQYQSHFEHTATIVELENIVLSNKCLMCLSDLLTLLLQHRLWWIQVDLPALNKFNWTKKAYNTRRPNQKKRRKHGLPRPCLGRVSRARDGRIRRHGMHPVWSRLKMGQPANMYMKNGTQNESNWCGGPSELRHWSMNTIYDRIGTSSCNFEGTEQISHVNWVPMHGFETIE